VVGSTSIRVGFGLGSNLGDRGEAIEKAFLFLGRCGKNLARSSIYESDPVDCPPDSPMFLNAVGELDYEGDLFELLQACLNYEREQGRPEVHARNAPRQVDIDLLYAGDAIFTGSKLTLPHPRLHLRAFVLLPLMEICPDRKIAGLDRSVRDLWEEFVQRGENQVCRKIA